MARVAKGSKDLQIFRGGLDDIARTNIWARHIGGACCAPGVAVDIDRLPPTVNWENANIHTSPLGGRDNLRISQLGGGDTIRREIVDHINKHGVGAQIAVAVLPTFGFLQAVHIVALAGETGLKFKVVTRNGTALPDAQVIKVDELDATGDCSGVQRTKAAGDLAEVGVVTAGQSRTHVIAVAADGGEFILEADELILEVTGVPADGVKGHFDLEVHVSYTGYGRSEAA